MEKIYWHKFIVNFAILIGLLLIYVSLKYIVEPSKNAGFFCNDYSITLPYKPSTVNDIWLHLISILVPFLVLLSTETVRAFYTFVIKGSENASKRNKYRIILPLGKELHLREQIGNLFVNYEYFLFGLLTNATLTMLAKILIGRLRPNFLSVCRPSEDPYDSFCGRMGAKFLVPGVDFKCASDANAHELAESRRSFPSGHSSSCFYTFLFLILFVNKFWTKRELGLFPAFFQVICFGVAVFVALSRILDNMHHVTDVLAGSLLGIIVALFTFHYLELFYTKHNYRVKYETNAAARCMNHLNNNEMDTFVVDDQDNNNKATINLPSMEIRYDI